MKPRDAFGVVLRTAGLLLVLYGVRAVASLAAVWNAVPFDGRQFGMVPQSLVQTSLLLPSLMALSTLAVGAYLLRGAPAILDYSYPAARGADRTLGSAPV